VLVALRVARLAGRSGKERVLSRNCFLCGDIRLLHPVFPVSWPRYFSESIGQQNFSADGFKAVAASHALGQFHQAVQTLGISGGVTVGEVVVKNGFSVVLNGECQGKEFFKDILCYPLEPSKVALYGNFFCSSFIDLIEVFFEMIGSLKSGEVLQPGFDNQRFMLVQVVGTPQEQVAVVHQCSALLVGQAFAYLPADMFQAVREHIQNMEFVHDQLDMWQRLMHCIVVRSIHISTHYNNSLFCGVGQTLQVVDNGCFLSIFEQINNMVVLDITDDTSVLVQQVQFVNAKVKLLCVWYRRLQASGELTEESTNGAFYQAGFIGYTHKGSSQCLLLDVGYQPVGHEVLFIHACRKLFNKGTTARTATVAMTLNSDSYAFASDRQVHEGLRFGFVAIQLVMVTMGTTKRWNSKFHLEVKVMCVFIYCKNVKAFQIQQIQGRYLLRDVTQGILIHASKSGSEGETITTSPFHALSRLWICLLSVKILYKFHAVSRLAEIYYILAIKQLNITFLPSIL
jgi:hypothetical protein